MSEPHSYRLTALPSRPNRVLPIGTIADGKHQGEPCMVHVHTGSTRIVAAADEPALRAHLEQAGLAGDYQLVPLQRMARSGHRRGQFAAPTRPRAISPSAPSSSPKGTGKGKGTEAKAPEGKGTGG